MNIYKKLQFLKNVSRFKERYKKFMRLMQFILQVGMRQCKKTFLKNIQY